MLNYVIARGNFKMLIALVILLALMVVAYLFLTTGNGHSFGLVGFEYIQETAPVPSA